jgi:hypothetical protein
MEPLPDVQIGFVTLPVGTIAVSAVIVKEPDVRQEF